MSKTPSLFLVTGAAGFIGAALVERLLKAGENVLGIDNLNNYYNPELKKSRLRKIEALKPNNLGSWIFKNFSIENKKAIDDLAEEFKPNIVVHLAAQAGVRYSIENPYSYINSNLIGFANILELCRKIKVENFVYASSSSVYGGNKLYPFKENHSVDHPLSLYAATKKSNEVMAHTYSYLYKIPSTGLRFFTVYGPWGRPDMAPMIFTKSIIEGKPLDIFNYGDMSRDFTYIDDIVEGIYKCCYKPATKSNSFDHINPDPSISFAPFRVLNIGNNKPIKLMKFIELLEETLEIKAIKNFKPLQKGDVVDTFSDIKKLKEWIDFSPKVPIEVGVRKFVKWYREFY
tara:strand:+ start:773 stop:1804 length:1032 start_codon:yes stop_codon:yes gene_type:complete